MRNKLAFLILCGLVGFGFSLIFVQANLSKAAVQDTRNISQASLTLSDASEKTEAFNLEDKCLLSLWVGTVVTTNITAECATSEAGTYNEYRDTSNTAVVLVTGAASNGAFDLTIDGKQLCGFIWCKLVAATDQTTDRTDWVITFGR